MIDNTLPQGLRDNPRLDQWIGFEVPNRVRISTGKVELGQGVLTALAQMAADELDVAISRIDMSSGDTSCTPEEGYTAGSLSIENSGGSIRRVAAHVRAMLCEAAAVQLSCRAGELRVSDGQILRGGTPTGLDYWQLAPLLDLTTSASGGTQLKSAAERHVMGTSWPRTDLHGKILGAATSFIHDLAPADMLHARILRQPWPDAELQGPSDIDMQATLGTSVRLVRLNTFVTVVAAAERDVVSAAERLATRLHWRGGTPIQRDDTSPASLKTQPSTTSAVSRGDAPATTEVAAKRISRSYSKPFLAHASIGPSCALAHFENGSLTVWTHSQGVFPLRGALARALRLDPAHVRVIHVPGAGCYGHNGADDVACDAAIIARELPGRTIRVLWSRADELAAAPFGPPMLVELEATVAPSGLPLSWTTRIWGGSHLRRPGAHGNINLLGAQALPDQPVPAPSAELPEQAGGSGMRNAWLQYAVSHQTVHNTLVADLAPRTSAMRGLGAFANVFAIESFVDELAAEAAADPVAFRLAMTPDTRARAVIEKAAAMAGWRAGDRRPEGHGRGFAFSRYKDRAGYLAMVVDVGVEDTVKLQRVWCAVDAGLVISPDGVRNQVEGGILQSASWTLKEQVLFEDGRVASCSWDSYPILRFSEVPEIDIALMDRPDDAPLGVGEVAQGPTAAAIANAVADALGLRLRDLPLTRERIIAALQKP